MQEKVLEQNRVLEQNKVGIVTESLDRDSQLTAHPELNHILRSFSERLDRLEKDKFSMADLSIVTCGSRSDYLTEQFRHLKKILVGVEKEQLSAKRFHYVFDKPVALCARAALEFRYQGYNDNEILLMLTKNIVHPALLQRLARPAKSEFSSSLHEMLTRAKQTRKHARNLGVTVEFLPIGDFDEKYARSVARRGREEDEEWVDDNDEMQERTKATFTAPPFSNEVLQSFEEPKLAQIEQAKERVGRWDQIDTLSWQKVEGLRDVGIVPEQVFSIIYVFEFLVRGKRKIDYGLYSHSFLRTVLEWWCSLKESSLKNSKDVKLATLVSEIEKKIKAEEW